MLQVHRVGAQINLNKNTVKLHEFNYEYYDN